MSGPPLAVAPTLAGVGIDVELDDEEMEHAIRSAIADRRGYLGDVRLIEHGWSVELLSPVAEIFTTR